MLSEISKGRRVKPTSEIYWPGDLLPYTLQGITQKYALLLGQCIFPPPLFAICSFTFYFSFILYYISVSSTFPSISFSLFHVFFNQITEVCPPPLWTQLLKRRGKGQYLVLTLSL
jgi:hypothetical protein